MSEINELLKQLKAEKKEHAKRVKEINARIAAHRTLQGKPSKQIKKKKPANKSKASDKAQPEYSVNQLKWMPYDEYLKTPYWNNFRTLILKRAGYKCAECGAKKELHVHHLTYERRGHENIDDVIALCKVCHAKRHDK